MDGDGSNKDKAQIVNDFLRENIDDIQKELFDAHRKYIVNGRVSEEDLKKIEKKVIELFNKKKNAMW